MVGALTKADSIPRKSLIFMIVSDNSGFFLDRIIRIIRIFLKVSGYFLHPVLNIFS